MSPHRRPMRSHTCSTNSDGTPNPRRRFECAALNPRREGIYYRLAFCCYRQERYREARQWFEKQLERTPWEVKCTEWIARAATKEREQASKRPIE